MSNPQAAAAKKTQNVSDTNTANLNSTAAGINSVVTPELKQEATNPTGYSPTDLNAMKVGSAEAAGGATAAADEGARLRAERTGNTSAISTTQDEDARNKARIMADTNLKVTGANANVKQEQQQHALSQLASLYGTNVSGGNQSTGNSLNAEKMEETQPGWLTGLNDAMNMSEKAALTGASIAG